jgi:hypothetical protein
VLVVTLICGILSALNATAIVQEQEWKLAPAPIVRIGEADGGEAYLLSNIRSVLRLPDGRIVVADGQSNQIRVYGADGKHIASHGRTGSGPGEYQWLHGLWRVRGDSMIALDQFTNKVTVLSPAFAPMRSTNWGPRVRFGGVSENGTYWMIGSATTGEIRPGVMQYVGLILRGNPLNESVDTLARTAGGRMFFKAGAANNQTGMIQYPIPFNNTPHHAIGRDIIFFGAGTKPEIERFDVDGRRLSPLQLKTAQRNVTPADVRRFEQWQIDQYPAARRPALRQSLTEVKAPEKMPAHGELTLDPEGNLWVQRYAPPWEPALLWDVYTAAGKQIASIRLPARFTIREIGKDYVLGVTKDEFDVERVEMYRLSK